jgi:hypothetical protein
MFEEIQKLYQIDWRIFMADTGAWLQATGDDRAVAVAGARVAAALAAMGCITSIASDLELFL